VKEKLINHVKDHRKRLGITQEELAKRVGVSRQSIISVEQGKYIPSLPLALKLRKLFQCSTDTLFELVESVSDSSNKK
jgi:putative transcriptional regulator